MSKYRVDYKTKDANIMEAVTAESPEAAFAVSYPKRMKQFPDAVYLGVVSLDTPWKMRRNLLPRPPAIHIQDGPPE